VTIYAALLENRPVCIETAHRRARRALDMSRCRQCGTDGPTDAALIYGRGQHVGKDGRAYSGDPTDYMPLCSPCHARYDALNRRGEPLWPGWKACLRCASVLSLDQFPPNRKTLDGVSSWCRECHRRYAREAYHLHPPLSRRHRSKAAA
jgi:hypothetical protein